MASSRPFPEVLTSEEFDATLCAMLRAIEVADVALGLSPPPAESARMRTYRQYLVDALFDLVMTNTGMTRNEAEDAWNHFVAVPALSNTLEGVRM